MDVSVLTDLQELTNNSSMRTQDVVGGLSCLFEFYGISTFVDYSIPNPFYTNKQFYFKRFSLE